MWEIFAVKGQAAGRTEGAGAGTRCGVKRKISRATEGSEEFFFFLCTELNPQPFIFKIGSH